jgi:hypothetical protein
MPGRHAVLEEGAAGRRVDVQPRKENTMRTQTLSHVATNVIDAYGHTAVNMIHAYRIGGERVIGFVDQRWQAAMQTGAVRLGDELTTNLIDTQKRLSGYYVKGLKAGSQRAEAAVNTAVGFAHKGVERFAANAEMFDKRTKFGALQTINRVALPAAAVIGQVATRIEEGSTMLVKRVAGKPAVVKAATTKARTVKKAAARTVKKAAATQRTAVRKVRAVAKRAAAA